MFTPGKKLLRFEILEPLRGGTGEAHAFVIYSSGKPLGSMSGGVLQRARTACQSLEWQKAFALLAEADRAGKLEPEGLELLAECARWCGRHERIVDPLERAHAQYAARQERRAAVRTALALCHANSDVGRESLAGAWWERADGLIAQLAEGPEHALHAWFHSRACGARGDLDQQAQSAERALELAQRFADRNVEALALIDLAHVATARGEHASAFERIKQATSLALGGEIDIFATGMVFCNAIWACRCRGEWQQAQDWTDSASRWVSRQQVEYFPGMCRVHRAEVLRIRGDLAAAEKECEAATEMVTRATPAYATFPWAELGEIRRRRGDLANAETAFQKALALGWDPQPGLALLLLDQGDAVSAHRAIEQAFGKPRPTMISEDRANLLSARATIAMAAEAPTVAEFAVAELETMAAKNATSWDQAVAAHARGMFELASGRTTGAIEHLTQARHLWGELETPYELGTTCMLLGQALDADQDRLRARLELQAAHDVFARIGAELNRQQSQKLLAGLDNSPPNDANIRRSTHPTPAPTQAVMERSGNTWSLDFAGRTIRLQNTRGLQHLATLLAQPGVNCWAIELAGAGNAIDRGDTGEVLDANARAAYQRRVAELEEELAETDARTDPRGAERIRTELDAIGRELAAAVGLGGRPRRAGSAVERARQSVTKGIRGAIRKISEEHPELGRYLDVTIKTGTACRFDPDRRERVEWHVDR